MPTVLRQEGFEVRIYFDDHEPPHVHVIKAGEEIVVNLGDETTKPWIRENKGMRQKDMRGALRIVAEYQPHLIAEWRRIHE